MTDGVVTLRPVTMDDLDAIVEQSRDPETVEWTFVPDPYGPDDARTYIDRSRQGWVDGSRSEWAIDHDGAFAGLVSHEPRAPGAVEVAYAAHPRARGRGVMTRAVRLVLRQAFDHGAQVVLWHARMGNFGSRRVAWRCGFTLTGPTVATRNDRVMDVWSGHLRRGEPREPRGRWLEVPTLEEGGIRLRPFRESDVEELPDEVDAATLAQGEHTPTRGDFVDWLLKKRTQAAAGQAVSVAVADSATDRLLGGVHVIRLDVGPLLAGTGMLGYWLLEPARGRGALGRALELLLPWAFSSRDGGGLGVHRIGAGCAVGNTASARVLRRAGFTLIGTERQLLSVQGRPSDALVFDLLASDDRDAQRVEPLRVPVFETRRFRLRPWGPGDTPVEGEGPDADSLRYLPPYAHPTAERFPEWLARRTRLADSATGVDWCVADRQTDHALGSVTVFHLDPGPDGFQAELGYWLHPPARGQAVLGEVLPDVVAYAFRAVEDGGLGLTRLHAGAVRKNAASQAVLQRVGFRPWGQDRQAWRNAAGDLTDGAYVELLATDPRHDTRPRSLAPVAVEGVGVRLRPFRDDDAERIAELYGDPVTRRWSPPLPQPYTEDAARSYLGRCEQQGQEGSALSLAVASVSDDLLVGVVEVRDLTTGDAGTGAVGYSVHPAARGEGVAAEAVRLLAAHALAPVASGGLGLHRLELRSAAANLASQTVAERSGFTRVGVERGADLLADGQRGDLVLFDRLADDDPAVPDPD